MKSVFRQVVGKVSDFRRNYLYSVPNPEWQYVDRCIIATISHQISRSNTRRARRVGKSPTFDSWTNVDTRATSCAMQCKPEVNSTAKTSPRKNERKQYQHCLRGNPDRSCAQRISPEPRRIAGLELVHAARTNWKLPTINALKRGASSHLKFPD